MKKVIYLIPIAILSVLASIAIIDGVAINITPSMPLGLYIKQSGDIKPGDIVAVCLTESERNFGLQRHYITKGNRCSGADPLNKKIMAVPGDKVILADEYIKINQQKYFYPTKYRDSQKRPLKVYPRGEYQHGYWIIGTNDKSSWDSRYFGPIEKAQILEKLRPLLILAV